VRRRLPVAAASAALAATLLTACHSNVGAAATVDGHRISESDVSKYLTANAHDLVANDSSGAPTSTPARSFVLNALVRARVFQKVLEVTPNGAPSPADLAAAQQQFLTSQFGGTQQQFTDTVRRLGLKSSFADVYLRETAYEQILTNDFNAGVNVDQIIKNAHPDVRINPRYGSWNATNFVVSTANNSGLPSFLRANARYTAPAAAPATPPSPAPSASQSPTG
jgi:hypothetical protein